MSLNTVYIGSTEVSKRILSQSDLDPELVVSFSEGHRNRVSGFTTYPSYGDRWETIDSINSQRSKDLLRRHDPDVIFVMAWQELLDQEVLNIPDRGCIGRHLSLLPKRRGRAPVAWALIHGLERTGVTFFWLDEGVDSGDILMQSKVPIDYEDEANDLHEKMTATSVEMMNETLESFSNDEYPREPQNQSKATYTHPRRPDMGLIDWTNSARRLYDFVRAQTRPYPGAFTYHAMDKIKVWHASVVHPTRTEGRPGEVLSTEEENTYLIQTGEGVLEVEVENVDGVHPIKIGGILGNHP